jgi:hypothetical protein
MFIWNSYKHETSFNAGYFCRFLLMELTCFFAGVSRFENGLSIDVS